MLCALTRYVLRIWASLEGSASNMALATCKKGASSQSSILKTARFFGNSWILEAPFPKHAAGFPQEELLNLTDQSKWKTVSTPYLPEDVFQRRVGRLTYHVIQVVAAEEKTPASLLSLASSICLHL